MQAGTKFPPRPSVSTAHLEKLQSSQLMQEVLVMKPLNVVSSLLGN